MIQIKKGDKYNRLTIIKEMPKKGKYRIVKCRCDCGVIKNITIVEIRRGKTKSCGCYKTTKLNNLNTTHGLSKTFIINTWYNIQARCYNKNTSDYKDYGGRGIKCEWKNFEEFYKDMGSFHKKGLSIDRIDNNGNYSKKNCRWATNKEQARNKRNNKIYKGKCLTEWCEELGLNYKTIYSRLTKGHKTFKQSLF